MLAEHFLAVHEARISGYDGTREMGGWEFLRTKVASDAFFWPPKYSFTF